MQMKKYKPYLFSIWTLRSDDAFIGNLSIFSKMLLWLDWGQCLLNSFINIRGITSRYGPKIQFLIRNMKAGTIFFFALLCYLTSSLHVHHPSHHHRDNGVRHQVAWGHYNSDNKPDMYQLSWLRNIPNDKLISMLSIPGTHDSGTYNCGWNQFCDISQCQSWTIYGQLMAGIRFLDVRVMTDESVIKVGHGSFKMMELRSLFSSVKDYLDDHPTQFVILSFQKERGSQQKTDQILDLMRTQGLIPVLTNSRIPTVGELRGKVWITRSYGCDIPGAYPLYGRQGVTDTSEAYMQNMYKVFTWSVGTKRDLVIKTAKKSCENQRLKVNYLSGSSGVFPYWLAKIDGGTNQALDVWLRKNPRGCLGITVMDYPGTLLLEQIIYSNY